MEPLNYNVDVKAPFEQAIGGFQVGQALGDQQLKRQDADRARQRQIEMQSQLAKLATNPNSGAREYSQVITMFPEVAEHLKKGYDILQPEQQQQKLSEATQVYAAINAGHPDIAVKLLTDRATANRNSGNEPDAKAAETMAKLIQLHEPTARTTAGLLLSSVMGADKFATTFPALQNEGRAGPLAPSTLAKSEADARKAKADATVAELEAGNTPQAISLKNQNTQAGVTKIYSDIRSTADRLALDKDKLKTEVELELYKLQDKSGTLPDDARKEVNGAVGAAVAAKQHSQQMIDLAGKFEKMTPLGGVAGKGRELMQSVLGTEDDVTAIRREFNRLKNTEALKLLPPGPASDRDISIVQKGFPTDTFNATEIADFLRVMAKLSQVESVTNSAKAEWVNYNHSLGNAKRDIVIDGVRVPAGSTFADFSSQFLKRKAELMGAEQSLGQAQKLGRGYLRYLDGTTPSGAAP